MPSSSDSPNVSPDVAAEPEWAALPAPRRPFRRLTFLVMGVTAAFSLFVGAKLGGEVQFALASGAPRDVGELSRLPPTELRANTWVRAEGALSERVVRYARPLEQDDYRLAAVEGNPKLWVELRVPSETDQSRFVAPGSFVGRLVPAARSGLRYEGLPDAIRAAGQSLPDGAWLLIDGESPAGSRWVLGLLALLLGFAVFNVVGIVRLARPIRDPATS